MPDDLVIDCWSDVVCPFCYLGSRQLRSALEEFEHRDRVSVRYRAFELDPHARDDGGVGLDQLLASKYGMPLEQARAANDRLSLQARSVGLEWSMGDARPTNTFDAHRLIALAQEQDRGADAAERLFHAYFSEGRLVSDHATLDELAAEVGVKGSASLWGTNAYAARVRTDEAEARELGITGVPAMLFGGTILVVGAQGSATMLDALHRAWDREG